MHSLSMPAATFNHFADAFRAGLPTAGQPAELVEYVDGAIQIAQEGAWADPETLVAKLEDTGLDCALACFEAGAARVPADEAASIREAFAVARTTDVPGSPWTVTM